MAVMRVEKNNGYTVMCNTHLRDLSLSLKAIGLLSKILSLPPDWDYTVEGLVQICKESRAAIDAAIHELEAGGYIARERERDERGRLAGISYTVYESPRAPICDFPKLDNPNVENPILENQQQINKDNINYLNNTPLTPQGVGGERAEQPDEDKPDVPKKPRRRKNSAKAAPDWEPEMFARFWAAYPRGEDRQAAIREWDKLKPDRALMMTMSAALARDKDTELWQRGIGIPYACRWLSHRRWEDTPSMPPDAGYADASPGGWAAPREVV